LLSILLVLLLFGLTLLLRFRRRLWLDGLGLLGFLLLLVRLLLFGLCRRLPLGLGFLHLVLRFGSALLCGSGLVLLALRLALLCAALLLALSQLLFGLPVRSLFLGNFETRIAVGGDRSGGIAAQRCDGLLAQRCGGRGLKCQ